MKKEIEFGEDIKQEKKDRHIFRTTFFLVLLIIILLILYGFFLGNSGMIVKEYEINNSLIPESFNNTKIAHFSDILYNDSSDLEKIKDAVQKINDKKVDIVIFTGGLVDPNYKINEKEISQITNELKKTKSTYGNYYVSAKDDKEIQVYDTIMQGSNFISLNDTADIIYSKKKEPILILGINNTSNTAFINDALKDRNNIYRIILFHESDLFDTIKDFRFNLALSGNSLNGQVNIPIIKEFFLPEGSKNYNKPHYIIDNTELYISSGIGTRNIDFRLFNKPSVNIYVLKKM